MKRRCPADSALIALFTAEGPESRKERLLRHLAICRRCALRFEVLRQVKRDLAPQIEAFAGTFEPDDGRALLQDAARAKLAENAARPRPERPRPRLLAAFLGLRFAAGFAAVLAVAAGGAYLTFTQLRRHAELRSPSVTLTLLEPAGRHAAPPRLLRWTPVLNAEGYKILLYDETLHKIDVLGTFLINEMRLSSEVRAKLIKGRTYVWTVSAFDGDNNLLAERSASFSIE